MTTTNINDALYVQEIGKVALSVINWHERFETSAIDTEDKEDAVIQLLLKSSLMTEELGEFVKDANHINLDGMMYELGDILYSVLDLILTAGPDMYPLLKQMRDSNDSKSIDTHVLNPLGTKLIKR